MRNLQHKQENCKEYGVKTPLLVSLKDAANILGVSARTVRRLCQDGKLPKMLKVGRSTRIQRQGILDYIHKISGGAV
jgi:excisionase family DNA binding protein